MARWVGMLMVLGCGEAVAQQPGPSATESSSTVIPAIVREISAARIEHSIRKLAAFETRHTLSETDSERRGIGAQLATSFGDVDNLSVDHP